MSLSASGCANPANGRSGGAELIDVAEQFLDRPRTWCRSVAERLDLFGELRVDVLRFLEAACVAASSFEAASFS